nr:immunoglobulin heavy chain junction region [Mus musculus]MBK4188628.1 immunoglobulin heavy chain junction region [Mus musculus]
CARGEVGNFLPFAYW